MKKEPSTEKVKAWADSVSATIQMFAKTIQMDCNLKRVKVTKEQALRKAGKIVRATLSDVKIEGKFK